MGYKPKIIIKKLNVDSIIRNFSIISNLLRTSYKVSFSENKIPEDFFENKVQKLLEFVEKDKAVVFGAFHEKMVGIIWGYHRDFMDEKRIHINHFVVDESLRGLGIGKSLISEMEKYAIKDEIRYIDLMVTADSPSVQFYVDNDYQIERYQMLKRL